MEALVANPINQLTFCEQYGIQGGIHRLEFHPQFVLVYGRRAEFDEQPSLRGARDFPSVRLTNLGVEAVVFPPTVRLGPGIAPSWLRVQNRAEALWQKNA